MRMGIGFFFGVLVALTEQISKHFLEDLERLSTLGY